MQDEKTTDPAELRRETHRRRVLAHMERTAREAPKPPAPDGQTVAQLNVPLIGEARRPESATKPPRSRGKSKKPKPQAAQLDLGV